MEPLFYLNQEAWRQYKEVISNGFKKVLPVACMVIEGLAFMHELENNTEIDSATKQTLLRLHMEKVAAEYGILPDDYVSAEQWQKLT
jgi:hypothetical protein